MSVGKGKWRPTTVCRSECNNVRLLAYHAPLGGGSTGGDAVVEQGLTRAAASGSGQPGVGGWLAELVAARRLGPVRPRRPRSRARSEARVDGAQTGRAGRTARMTTQPGAGQARPGQANQHAVRAVEVPTTHVVQRAPQGENPPRDTHWCHQRFEGARRTACARRARSAVICCWAVRVSPTSKFASSSSAAVHPGGSRRADGPAKAARSSTAARHRHRQEPHDRAAPAAPAAPRTQAARRLGAGATHPAHSWLPPTTSTSTRSGLDRANRPQGHLNRLRVLGLVADVAQ